MRDESQTLRAIRHIQLRDASAESAMRWLYEEYRPYVIRTFMRDGFRRDEAEDLTQDTFVRVLRGIPDFRGDSRFSTWLFMIARGVAANEIRRRNAAKRESPLERSFATLTDEELIEIEGIADPSPNPEEGASVNENISIFSDAVDRMPEMMRRCFQLTLQGYTMRDIAAMLAISTGTVKVHLHRARRMLEKMDLPLGGSQE
jgi:RNA polymerase sigma-70 factor (ECF subfamily)